MSYSAHSKLVQELGNLKKLTILDDKNRINDSTISESILSMFQLSVQHDLNLHEFKQLYSNYKTLIEVEIDDIKDVATALTAYGIKFKYLNQKKIFPAKLTKEQLKLKKAIACLEISKVHSMLKWIEIAASAKEEFIKNDCNRFNQKLFYEVEKIAKHFDETFKTSDGLDECFNIAACKLGQIYLAIGKKSKAKEFCKKIAQSLKSYVLKPKLKFYQSHDLNQINQYICKLDADNNPRKDIMHFKYDKKFTQLLLSEINSTISKIIPKKIKHEGREAFTAIQKTMQFYEKMKRKERQLENSKCIMSFVRNQMLH